MSAVDNPQAQQGHPYFHRIVERRVLALESGPNPKVLFLDPKEPWNWETARAYAQHLAPEPLRYFHGELPK